MKGVQGKAADRERRDQRFPEYCNDLLLTEHDESSKYDIHRATQTVFYVKRVYFDHDTTPDEDLDLPLSICQSLFDKIDESNAIVQMKANEKKQLKEEKEKLFTGGKKALDEYKSILRRVMVHVIPSYERTRTVQVLPGINTNEWILVCDFKRMVKWGLACRHIYAILKRNPQLCDAMA